MSDINSIHRKIELLGEAKLRNRLYKKNDFYYC
jgi:hypothetical protein